MKKIFSNFAAAILTLTSITACDEGRIYPETTATTEREGLVMRLTGNITGLDSWADGYSVVVAAFDETSPYALITKNLTAEGNVDVTMNAIPQEATTVELCIIDRLRQRVATIEEAETSTNANPRDTIRMDVGTVDVGMLAQLQSNVFTPRCAGCHGLSSYAAADVNLTEGKTYDNIVGKPSKHVSGKNIVEPGNYEESVIAQMLDTELTATWGYDHQHADISDTWREILKKWIEHIGQ
ncbi:MAG: hypothetical protein ACI4B3_07750 [Prevotella sp.]